MKAKPLGVHMITRIIDKAIKVHGINREMWKDITNAKFLEDLAAVSAKYIDSFDGPFAIGIGPMTTGNKNSFSHNLDIFDRTYDWFLAEDNPLRLPVFYQLAFEMDIQRIREQVYEGRDHDFSRDLFRIVYGPIMKHSNLKRVLLVPDWGKSHGAMEEYKMLNEREQRPEFIDIANILPDVVGNKKLYISDI